MYRAMVVDDEHYTREGMRLLIDWASAGFHLIGTAEDADSALLLMERERPELVFLDVRMPGMSGCQLAEQLHQQYPELLIAFLSGYNRFEYAQAAIRAGAFCFLLKPIDPEEIGRELRKAAALLSARPPVTSRTISERTGTVHLATEPADNPLLHAMRVYLEQQFSAQPTLAELASTLGLHQGYLGQQIIRLSGQSFGKHLSKIRIERAKTLLLGTDWPVKRVSLSVGILDMDYFSAQFKQATGFTPNQFKAQGRQS